MQKLIRLKNIFSDTKEHLRECLREEELLSHNLVKEQGFLLRKYSLKEDTLTDQYLDVLENHLDAVANNEDAILEDIAAYRKELKLLERVKEGIEFSDKKIRFEKDFISHLKNGLHMTKLAKQQVIALRSTREAKYLTSLEKMLTQIANLFSLSDQIVELGDDLLSEQFYEDSRQYGRVMSEKEAKATLKTGKLQGSPSRGQGEPIAVFDSPRHVQDKISSMTKDQRKNYFSTIGVRGGTRVVFFRTRRKPLVETPVPQSNGLYEYKFPKGLPLEDIKAA